MGAKHVKKTTVRATVSSAGGGVLLAAMGYISGGIRDYHRYVLLEYVAHLAYELLKQLIGAM